MSAARMLTADETKFLLRSVSGWTVANGRLHRDLTFRDFASAWRFMTEVAKAAEDMDHHPEWFNVYNKVSIDLITHSVGGISDRDFELARRIDLIAGDMGLCA